MKVMIRNGEEFSDSICYWCGSIATTKEHAPPKAFFPKRSETPEQRDLRKNLITVPSCDDHNITKSVDDEYLFAVISSHIENNPLARIVFKRIVRSINKKPRKGSTFFSGFTPINVGGIETGCFRISIDRFNHASESIARAIHYHHFRRRAPEVAHVFTQSLIDISSPNRGKVNQAHNNWRKVSKNAFIKVIRNGENQEAFYYQLADITEDPRYVIRLVFYEGVVIDVIFVHN